MRQLAARIQLAWFTSPPLAQIMAVGTAVGLIVSSVVAGVLLTTIGQTDGGHDPGRIAIDIAAVDLSQSAEQTIALSLGAQQTDDSPILVSSIMLRAWGDSLAESTLTPRTTLFVRLQVGSRSCWTQPVPDQQITESLGRLGEACSQRAPLGDTRAAATGGSDMVVVSDGALILRMGPRSGNRIVAQTYFRECGVSTPSADALARLASGEFPVGGAEDSRSIVIHESSSTSAWEAVAALGALTGGLGTVASSAIAFWALRRKATAEALVQELLQRTRQAQAPQHASTDQPEESREIRLSLSVPRRKR